MRNYSLRFCLSPSVNFEKRINQLVDFCEDAQIDDVMFFIAPEELFVGHISKEQAKKYVDVILKAKSILDKKDITVSLNPWVTLGHWTGGRKLLEDQDFRTMVGHDGTTSEIVACPLCENWREYFIDLMNYYVESINPKILWFEDDFRLSNHEPITLGCFCEEHVKMFNERAGTNFDREGIINAIFSDEKYQKIYLDLARYTFEHTFEQITSKIKNQPTLGLMTGGACLAESKRFGTLFNIMHANSVEKPYNRICLYSYRQKSLQEYAWHFNAGSMLVRFLTGKTANCMSEMENIPYSLYTKTANFTKYQMVTSAPLCLCGDTLNIFDVNGNGAINFDRYANVLKTIKSYLSAVTDLNLGDLEASGIQVLVNENSSYSIKGAKTFKKLNPTDYWIFAYLEQLGFNCAYTSNIEISGKTIACSGQVLRNYTDTQIIDLFAKNTVVLTGDCVEVLKDRNLAHLVGVVDYKLLKERSGTHSIEQWAGEDKVCGIEKLRANFQFFCGDYFDIEYDKKVDKTLYTEVLDHNENVVGCGIVKVGNAVILPYQNISSEINLPLTLICPLRAEAIKRAIMCGDNAKDLFFVEGETNCIYTFKYDGGVYAVIVNFTDDDFEDIRLNTVLDISDAEILTVKTPTFTKLSIDKTQNGYIINHELKAQESLVLKLK